MAKRTKPIIFVKNEGEKIFVSTDNATWQEVNGLCSDCTHSELFIDSEPCVNCESGSKWENKNEN